MQQLNYCFEFLNPCGKCPRFTMELHKKTRKKVWKTGKKYCKIGRKITGIQTRLEKSEEKTGNQTRLEKPENTGIFVLTIFFYLYMHSGCL